MIFQDRHRFLSGLTKDFNVIALAKPDIEKLIEEAVREAGRENKRACPLVPRVIVWLVVLMALQRSSSIVNVFGRLLSWYRHKIPFPRRNLVTEEALYHARKRLGALPLKLLFRKLLPAKENIKPGFRGLRVFGIDGTHFDVPDTPKNRAVFRSHTSQYKPGAFPQLMGTFLMELTNRRLMECCFLPCLSGEIQAVPFLVKSLGTGDLLLVDRGLFSAKNIYLCLERGTHILFRAKANWGPKPVSRQGPGDYLILLEPGAKMHGPPMLLRLLEFHVGSSKERVRLVTDLVDRRLYPARELARLYHQRWECELGFKEVKAELMSQAGSKLQTHFRSKSPVGVLQEAWGLAIAHALIRDTMAEAAEIARVPVLELSFVNSKDVIVASIPGLQAARNCDRPYFLRLMCLEIGTCRIDRPRRKRQVPRVVKRRSMRFPIKKPEHQEQRLDPRLSFKAA